MRPILRAILVLLLFEGSQAFCQRKQLTYKILNDTFKIDPRDPVIKLELELINESNKDYILYNYYEIDLECPIFKSIQRLNCVVGNSLYILQGYKRRIGGEPFHNENIDDFRHITFDAWAKRTSVILRSNTSIKLIRELNLKSFGLEPWEYELSLVYYSGRNTKNYFTEEEISDEEKKYGATFFRGWIQSNSVPLIVRYVP